MKCFSLLLTAVLSTVFTPSAQAVEVFSDDFSEPNGTLLNGKSPDVGSGTWFIAATNGNLQEINGGVVDSFTNPTFPGPFTAFSSGAPGSSFAPLAAGQVFKFSFSTVESGGPFHGGNLAGFDLYAGLPGGSRAYIGSKGTGADAAVWRVEDGVGGANALTAVSGEAQNGIFNYNYDSGDWNVSFNGGATYAQAGTLAPGIAFDRVRMSSSGGISMAVDSVAVDISTAPALPTATIAFPGAVGQGAASTGGRGGDVYRVTNLSDYDAGDPAIAGSLRDAIESAAGPRTIVFDVGGALELSRTLNVTKDNLTLAGQTSPSGITLYGYPTVIRSEDVIIRQMRFRTGDFNATGNATGNMDLDPQAADAIAVFSANRVILDSVSTSWSMDETLSVTGSKDVTVQNSIISEGLDASFHPSGNHSMGSLVRGDLTDAEQTAGTGGYTFYGNLWASQGRRSPGLGGNDVDPTRDTDINIVNNVIYNFGDVATNREGLGDVRANVVGNYYISGPDSPGDDVVFTEGFGADTTEVYQEGNFRDSDQDAIHDGTEITNALQAAAFTGFSGADVLLNSSTGSAFNFFSSVAAEVLSAEDAYAKVVNSVGASLFRDAIDTRLIAELEGRTGGIIDSQEIFRIGGVGGVIDGLDNLPVTMRAAGFDTDGDGMPDTFEAANGLDSSNPDDRNFVDISLDGYTNLEVYLNSLTALAGDFDNDDDVDGFDFLIWQRGFGSIFTADDLTDWATNFGTGVGPLAAGLAASAAAVPEPSTAVLVSMALAGLAASRRRRKQVGVGSWGQDAEKRLAFQCQRLPELRLLTIGRNLYGRSRIMEVCMFYEKRIGRFFLFLVLTASVVCVAPLRAQPSIEGEWTEVIDWNLEAIHTIMLPTGKTLVWQFGTSAQLWDPVTELFSAVPTPDYNIFCAGHAWLPDGRLLVVGGQLGGGANAEGEPRADIYDPFTNTWAGNVPDMNSGRWYPSVTTLGNGDVLVMTGSQVLIEGSPNNPLPQVYEFATNTWRDLTTAQKGLRIYTRTFLAPDGRVVSLAGQNDKTELIDTSGTGQWSYVADFPNATPRDAPAVMYEPGKVAFFGGGSVPTADILTLDLNVQNPQWVSSGTMSQPRRQQDATILADGTVLITGGTSESGWNDPAGSISAVELWDPDTGLITEVAEASSEVYRGYHTTATLLYDGRVLMTGGDSVLGANENAEIYSPAYLFNGARPTITTAPESVGLGSTFFVATPDAADIAEITFLVPGAVTHSQNWTQRINYLEFTEVAGGLNVTLPSNANEAPPGYYMLFLLNDDGVPSVAEFVRLSANLGDFDADSDIDGFDFLKWQRGVANANDLADWETNFGTGVGPLAGLAASTAVPEPSTAVLLSLALAGLATNRRRRK